MQQRWKNILFNITLSFNCLLLLFVLFGEYLAVPAWLQVIGRMHPLVLHFPIVLLLVYIFWSLWLSLQKDVNENNKAIAAFLLLVAAFTSAFTALAGILLSKEPGYDPEGLQWHKWSGTAVSVFSFCWYAMRNSIQSRRWLPVITGTAAFVLVLFTGHEGAGITHGQDFLLAPVMHDAIKPKPAMEDAVVFTDMVNPILEAKCMSCHNSKKAKGELIMETKELLLKGGKHGALWEKEEPELSLLLKRIHLPVEEKKHMPPQGKPQLNEEESTILYQWIKSGAAFTTKVSSLAVSDTLKMLAVNMFRKDKDETYDFDAADEKKIQQLNNTNRIIHPLSMESPALAVNFYNRQNYNTPLLKDILPIKEQVVSLDMAYMPLKEEDIPVIAQFNNLRKLNLNFTTVPGKSLQLLKQLTQLKSISLAGTTVNKSNIEALTSFPKLESVYLWSTAITSEDIKALRKAKSSISFENGFKDDTVILKLTPPILENESRVIVTTAPLQFKHYIKGVNIHYTLDGSEPDSIHSPVYNKDVVLSKSMQVKARAFKPGWISSDAVAADFYKNGYKPDSLYFLTPPDSQHMGIGSKTLIDGEKGDFNFRTNKWLAYRKNKMEVLLQYNKPVTVSSVILTTVTDVGSFIFPPVSIEVWGGNGPKNLKLLSHIQPSQPSQLEPASFKGYECIFANTSLSYLKLVAIPVAELPAWHPSSKEHTKKIEKAWIFTDEIFVN